MDKSESSASSPAGGERAEQEYYIEPAPLSRRDSAGVVMALIALALIGFGGYVWLNPRLGWRDLLPAKQGVESAPEPASAAAESMQAVADPLADPSSHNHDMSCPHCGMYSDRSLAHIVIEWSNQTHTHHDCWDCAFAWGRSQSLELKAAVITQFAKTTENPVWLAAESATYLYDTKPFQGSMPPFTAAFASPEDAQAAKAELGGEQLDWAGLKSKFSSGGNS